MLTVSGDNRVFRGKMREICVVGCCAGVRRAGRAAGRAVAEWGA